MREQERGNIKIGITADPQQRLSQLQSGNSDLLSIEGLAIGSEIAEYVLHVRFSQHHIRGEWFRPADEVVAFMDTLPSIQDAEAGEPLSDLDAEFAHEAIGFKMAGLTRRRLRRR